MKVGGIFIASRTSESYNPTQIYHSCEESMKLYLTAVACLYAVVAAQDNDLSIPMSSATAAEPVSTAPAAMSENCSPDFNGRFQICVEVNDNQTDSGCSFTSTVCSILLLPTTHPMRPQSQYETDRANHSNRSAVPSVPSNTQIRQPNRPARLDRQYSSQRSIPT